MVFFTFFLLILLKVGHTYIYNQILSFAFKSTVLTIKAKEKNGIDGEINVEKLNGIAIKNCKHAMMMLLQ